MGTLIGIVIGVLTGVASSYMVWRYVISLRPKLAISPRLAFASQPNDGKYRISFKVVNNGPRIVHNVEVFFNGLKKHSSGNAAIKNEEFRIEDFKFSRELALGTIKGYTDVWSLSPFTIFTAYSASLPRDLLDTCDRLSVRIVAIDERSGSRFYARQYFEKKDCIEGAFGPGIGFDIGPDIDESEGIALSNP